jgi:hypothetical protein
MNCFKHGFVFALCFRCITVFLLSFLLGGCAAPLAAPTVAQFFITTAAPVVITGKGLTENGADLVTGKDCRFFESALRKERKICEERGSPETEKDFKGLAGAKLASASGPPRVNQ